MTRNVLHMNNTGQKLVHVALVCTRIMTITEIVNNPRVLPYTKSGLNTYLRREAVVGAIALSKARNIFKIQYVFAQLCAAISHITM